MSAFRLIFRFPLAKMKSFVLIIMLYFSVLGLHAALYAQESTIGTLPMIQTSDHTPTSSANNVKESTDLDIVKTIYDKLVKARGDNRFPVPQVFLRDEVSRVASINYDLLEIVIEKKAFDACKPYGDAAIAFLLGHELTHYYEKHAWKSGFAADNSDLKVGKNIKKIQDQVANETQADYLGGFLAYSAGYGMFDKGDALIKALYKEYKIGELMPGYPSLTDRMELAKRSAAKLASLVDVFEMANYLVAIGKYGLANDCYKYILMHYQSREIYNNVGVNALLEGLGYFSAKELQYQYVAQLDLQARSSRDASTKALSEKLLREAVVNFDRAISLDPDYAPAYFNKATAYALLNDTVRAAFYADKEAFEVATRTNNIKTLTDLKVLQGILLARAGKSKEAEQIFDSLARTGNTQAIENLKVVRTGKGTERVATAAKLPVLDTVGGISLKSFARDPSFLEDKVVQIKPSVIFFQYTLDTLDYKIVFTDDSEQNLRTYLLLTKEGKKLATSKGVLAGDLAGKVVSIYGDPVKRVETTQGQLLVYDNLLFVLDKEQKVRFWGNFLTQKP
jgi:tetratricopeptide (TPR) repeat protein